MIWFLQVTRDMKYLALTSFEALSKLVINRTNSYLSTQSQFNFEEASFLYMFSFLLTKDDFISIFKYYILLESNRLRFSNSFHS